MIKITYNKMESSLDSQQWRNGFKFSLLLSTHQTPAVKKGQSILKWLNY